MRAFLWDILSSKLRLVVAVLLSLSATNVPIPALSQELQEIVRDGNYEQLRKAILEDTWSQQSLDEALVAAAGLNKPDAARLLLSKGANPNESFLGLSSVVIAVREGSADALVVLLEDGGDPNWLSNFDWRPLHHAVGATWSFDKIIEILVKHGAEIDAVTNLKVTPLHRAAGFCQGSAVRMLVRLGADMRRLDKYGQTAADRARKKGCANVAALLE